MTVTNWRQRRLPFRAVVALLAAVTAGLLVAGCTADEKPDAEKKADKKVSVLFVVNATDGSMRGDDKSLTLVMKLQNHSDFWFTDRPDRRAGHLNTTAFIKTWDKAFKSDPPNAVLVVDSGRGERGVPLTLRTPVLEGKTVTFRASRLSDIPEGSALKHHKQASSLPTNFEHASLFIDDAEWDLWWTCVHQLTNTGYNINVAEADCSARLGYTPG